MLGVRGAAAPLSQGFDRHNLAGIDVEGFDGLHAGADCVVLSLPDASEGLMEEPPTPTKPPKRKNKSKSQSKQVKEFLNMFKDDHFEPLEEDPMENLDTVVVQVERPENLFKRIDSWLNSKGITVCSPDNKKFVFYERKRSIVSQKLSNSNSPTNFIKLGIKSESTEDSDVPSKPSIEKKLNLRARLVDSIGSIPEIAIIEDFSTLSSLASSLPALGKSHSSGNPSESVNFLDSSPNFDGPHQQYQGFKFHKNSIDLSLSNLQ